MQDQTPQPDASQPVRRQPPGRLVTRPKRRRGTDDDPHFFDIGPRHVGGRYWSAYTRQEYDVIGLDRSLPGWPAWQVTVRDVGGATPGATRWHCTGWDYAADRVIADPTDYQPGQPVRDRKWGGAYTGTVTRVDPDGAVIVRWDGTTFEDQLTCVEIEPYTPDASHFAII